MKDKKGSTFVIIMVIVSISIYIIVTVGIKVFEKVDFINYDKESKKELKDINKKYEDNEYAFNYDLTKNIEIKDYYIKDEGILIEITNKNDYPITSRIYTEFYDEKDELITVETNYIISISGAGKSYEKIYLNEELKKRYKSYKIKAIAEYDQYKLNLEDKIELISSKRDGSYYTIDFKNNSKYKIDSVYWGFIYYNNNEIVYYNEDSSNNVKSKETKRLKVVVFKDIEYDRVEPVLLCAYKSQR